MKDPVHPTEPWFRRMKRCFLLAVTEKYHGFHCNSVCRDSSLSIPTEHPKGWQPARSLGFNEHWTGNTQHKKPGKMGQQLNHTLMHERIYVVWSGNVNICCYIWEVTRLWLLKEPPWIRGWSFLCVAQPLYRQSLEEEFLLIWFTTDILRRFSLSLSNAVYPVAIQNTF